jgi:hypothetical protein
VFEIYLIMYSAISHYINVEELVIWVILAIRKDESACNCSKVNCCLLASWSWCSCHPLQLYSGEDLSNLCSSLQYFSFCRPLFMMLWGGCQQFRWISCFHLSLSKWKQCPRARLYLVTPRDHNYNKNVKVYQFCNLECKWSAWVKLFEGFLSVTYLTDRGLEQWVSWLLCLSWGLVCISFTVL